MTATLSSDTPVMESIFTAQRFRLGDMMRAGVPPVGYLPAPTLGEKLFYEWHVQTVAGHKKAGKTWVITVQTADMIKAGRHVVYIDNENGREVFAERLIALGCDPEQVDQYLIYVPFPPAKPSLDGLRAELEAIAVEYPASLVVIDSQRSFMSYYGLKSNDDVDVEAFLGPIMGAVKNRPPESRITVVVIDHANRNTKSGAEYAAGGSQAKAAGVDVSYLFTRVERFSESVRGLVKIEAVDDRRGKLVFERYYRVGGQGEGNPIHFESVTADEAGADGRIWGDVRQHMMDSAGADQTKTAIRGKVRGDNSKVDKALAALVNDPSDPVWSKVIGQRTVYVWDENWEVGDGLPME